MKTEEKLKAINEIESIMVSCSSCINTMSSALNSLTLTLNSIYASIMSLKNDINLELNYEKFKQKLTYEDLFDYDESFKDFPGTAIIQACEQTGMVSNFEYMWLEREFISRGWKVLHKIDFNPQPSPEDYNNYKCKIINIVRELYNKKFGSDEQQREQLFGNKY